MSSIAVIYEAVVNVLRVCNKCCKEDKKDKEDEEDEEEEESKESEEKVETKDSETDTDSEEAKTKSPSKPKTTKTRKKKKTEYSAVKQAEPTTTQPQPTFQNHFNPVFTIINSPYSSGQHNLPGVQPGQATGTSSETTAGTTTKQSVVEWVPSTLKTAGELVDRAVIGGHDIDESDLWIIRARILGEVIPGKLNHLFGLAFVIHRKNDVYAERNVDVFEVCCVAPESSHRIKWVHSRDGDVPKNAVPGGRKSSGETFETLYIGRHLHQDEKREDLHSVCPGLIQPSHGVLYITYDFKVYSYKSYEVLCVE